MIGLCFEADTPCSSCSRPLPLNALVETIVCTECRTVNKFSVDEWKELLEDLFKSGISFQENEGQPSSVMGSRNYSLSIGRQNPKFSDSKTYIDMEDAVAAAETGKIINPQTQVPYSIRKLPEKFASACPNVRYLVGEDFTLLPNYSGSSLLDNKDKELIPFTCPNCAGTLQMDGSERKLKCQHCSTESYIPDTSWQKMHPVKPRQRFYFWYDEKTVKFEWDDDLYDCVADEEATLYLSLDPSSMSNDELWIVALNPDLTIKWKRNNLKFKFVSDGKPQLGLTNRGELMISSWDRHAMLLLSCKDGSDIKKVGVKNEDEDKTLATVFDFKLGRSITPTPDGKYFVYADRGRRADNDTHCEFLMLDEDANISPPWSEGGSAKKGLFGSMKKAFSNIGDVKYLETLKSYPTLCRTYEIELSSGRDGSIYMVGSYDLLKFDKNGELVFRKKLEEEYIRHKVAEDMQGNAYFLSEDNQKNIINLIRVDGDGGNSTILIKGVLEGGLLCDEDKLAIGGNGMIYCLGYGGRIRIFNLDGTLIFASESSLEEAKDKLKEKEEMED